MSSSFGSSTAVTVSYKAVLIEPKGYTNMSRSHRCLLFYIHGSPCHERVLQASQTERYDRISRYRHVAFLTKAVGPYRDISVSFSHDPCEKPLNLITQMPGSRNAVQPNGHNVRARQASGLIEGQQNGHSYRPYHPRTGSEQSSRHQGSTSADSDGWQTVGKRR